MPMSWIAEDGGGGLIEPALYAGTRPRRTGTPPRFFGVSMGTKGAVAAPSLGESYFATCERDDEGRCLPSGRQRTGATTTRPANRPPTVRSRPEGGVRLRPTKERAFTGEQVPLKHPLSKQEAGALGEQIVTAYLKSQGMVDARPLNAEVNNFPIDLIQDHECVEVKTGQVGNSPGAQQWRLTLGEPGKAEKEWLKTASAEDKAAWNARKMKAVHARKEKERRRQEKRLGRKVKAMTMTVLIDPDRGVADVFRFDGWHPRIGWNSDLMRGGYVGSVKYEQ